MFWKRKKIPSNYVPVCDPHFGILYVHPDYRCDEPWRRAVEASRITGKVWTLSGGLTQEEFNVVTDCRAAE
jgi:hypothetical protein